MTKVADIIPPTWVNSPWLHRMQGLFAVATQYFALRSRLLAAEAATKITNDVKAILGSPNFSNANQKILLVGHSRGAAVNALVSRQLAADGYHNVVDYIALDGFSTDWPEGAGVLGDWPIAGSIGAIADHLFNYRAREGLASVGGDFLTQFLADHDYHDTSLDEVFEVALFSILGDLRAPERSPWLKDFEFAIGTSGELSTHVNITKGYLDSIDKTLPTVYQYIRDNYIGGYISTGMAGLPNSNGSLSAASPSIPVGFLDGLFTALGQLYSSAITIVPQPTGDPFLDSWATMLTNPAQLLSMIWETRGDVRFVPQNTSVQLTQSADSRLAQTIHLPDGTSTVEFDLMVLEAGSNDVLQVMLGDAVLGEFVLSNILPGRYSVTLPANHREYDTITFRLAGPEDTPAIVRLDSLSIGGQENWSPLVNSDEYSTTSGTPLTVNAQSGLLRNDLDPDGQSLSVTIASGPTHGQLMLATDGSFLYTPDGGFVGMDSFTYTAADGHGGATVGLVTISVVAQPVSPPGTTSPPVTPPSRIRLIADSVPANADPVVLVKNSDGTLRFTLSPVESQFRGGLPVVVGDVTGDGIDDVIVGTGIGGGPRVQVFDGATGDLIANYFAFEPEFRGGVMLATAEGVDYLAVTPGLGGGPVVRLFDAMTGVVRASYLIGPDMDRLGAQVVLRDVDNDGTNELIASSGESLKVFSPLTGEDWTTEFAAEDLAGVFVG